MRPLADYTAKENYNQPFLNPNYWKNHINGRIIKFYHLYIKGLVGDLGCNHGACTWLLTEGEIRKNVIGIDLQAFDSHLAFMDSNGWLAFVQADIRSVPLPDNTFDTITSFHTLEHIYPDDIRFVAAEIRRILKPGCYFIASVPYQTAYANKAHVTHLDEMSLLSLMEMKLVGLSYEEKCLTGVFRNA